MPEFLSPKILQAYRTLSKNCQRCHIVAIGQGNTILEENSQSKNKRCNLLENTILHP